MIVIADTSPLHDYLDGALAGDSRGLAAAWICNEFQWAE
jgi:hypothetical protein